MASRPRSSRCAAGALAAAALAAVVSGPALAQACGLDGVPSMSINNKLVKINNVVPRTQAQATQWAQFTAAASYKVKAVITLTENRKELAKTLVPRAMQRPWRWRLGDGTVVYGWTVSHAYKRAGHWRVLTDAYLASTHQWYNFDQAVVVVHG